MYWITTKYCITAAVVVLVSELAKHSDKQGGLIAALTIVCVAGFALVMRQIGIDLL